MTTLPQLLTQTHNKPHLFSAAPLVAMLMAEYGSMKALGPPASRAMYRYLHRGMNFAQADWWACHYGWHPCEVWGDEWWQAA